MEKLKLIDEKFFTKKFLTLFLSMCTEYRREKLQISNRFLTRCI